MLRWATTGHYGGTMPGAAAEAGTAVLLHGTDMLRVEEERIVEYLLNADSLALMTPLQGGAG